MSMKIGSMINSKSYGLEETKEKDSGTVKDNSQVNNKQGNSATIYAGDMTFVGDDIAQKKADAAKEAIKTIFEQFASDIEFDEGIQKIRNTRDELLAEAESCKEDIKQNEESLEKLKADYNIDENSPENRELELRRKEQSGEALSEEELAELETMAPPSEYQQRALERYKEIDYSQGRIDGIEKIVEECNKSLAVIKIANDGRKKEDTMLGATEKAEEILAQANDEINQMMISDAVETIDDKNEEVKEKTEELKEEKKEEDIKKAQKELEKAIEEAAKNNKHTSMPSNINVSNSVNSLLEDDLYNQLMVEINEIAELNALSEEDIKGLLTDIKL